MLDPLPRTWRVPLIPPLLAVTVPLLNDVLGAVNSPPALIVPAVVPQVNVGCAAKATPNWSFPVAVNCCVAPALRLAADGLTAIAVSVWFTVTSTLLVAVSPPASVIVTVKLYAPAWLKVAVVFFAPLRAVDAERHAGRRSPRGGPRVGQVRLAAVVRPQHRKDRRGAVDRRRARCRSRGHRRRRVADCHRSTAHHRPTGGRDAGRTGRCGSGIQPAGADRAYAASLGPRETRLAAQGNPKLVFPSGRELLRCPALRLAAGGLTTIAVSVWFTVTLTLLVAVSPPASVIVTCEAIRCPPG